MFIEHFNDFRRGRKIVETEKLKLRNHEERLFILEIDRVNHYINSPKHINPDFLFDFDISVVKHVARLNVFFLSYFIMRCYFFIFLTDMALVKMAFTIILMLLLMTRKLNALLFG